MAGEEQQQSKSSVYSGMTWPGMIGYILDKHLLNVIILALICFILGGFLFLYFNAQSAVLQQNILTGTYSALSNLNITYSLGWILSGLLGLGIIVMRSVYKKEIHRLSEGKSSLLKKLGVNKGSSGHKETDMS